MGFRAAALVGVSALLLLSSASGVRAAPASLTVTFEGLRNDKGAVWFCLWQGGQSDFPKCVNGANATQRLKAPATAPKVVFTNVAPGTYAVTALHDETGTGNGEFNILGLPKSGVGLSNAPALGMGNRPTFDKGKFTVPGTTSLTIKANYLF